MCNFAEDYRKQPETVDAAAFMWAQGWMSAANEDALGHDLKPVT